MKIFRTFLLSLALLLTLTACGQERTLVDGSATATEIASPEVAAWDYFPRVFIHYEDEAFESSAELTRSEIFTWQATMTDGSHALTVSDGGARPYQMENLCTVILADTVGKARLAILEAEMNAIEGAEFYAAEALPGLTLTAYPVAEDGTVNVLPEAAQSIHVKNARFTLPVGKYYYELVLPRNGGVLTYGFIAHRIDAENYKVTEHVSGCIVEVEYEDPDHQIKQLPTLHLMIPFGREENTRNGMVLHPCGKIMQTYTNYAGTGITRRIDLKDPMAEEDMHFVTTSRLNTDYKIEWSWQHQVTAAHYERYRHDGTPVDSKALIAADIVGTDTVCLTPNFYYVFTVYYENMSVQYVLKTGMGVEEITPHPMDDASIDPALAKHLRAEHMHYFHVSTDTLDTVDVFIYRYLGSFDGMEAVIFEEPDSECTLGEEALTLGGQTFTLPGGRQLLFYHTHRFYTPEEAYQNGWITDGDVAAIAARLQQTDHTQTNGGTS